MAKVHPKAYIDDDDDDDFVICDESCCSRVCCVRCCCFFFCTGWLILLSVIVSLPHMIRAFDELSDEERLGLSAGFGGAFVVSSCSCFCACCCVLYCCAAPSEVDVEATRSQVPQTSLRRSSLTLDGSVDWLARLMERASATGLISEATASSTSAGMRRMSLSLGAAERRASAIGRASSLRTSRVVRSSMLRSSTSTLPTS